MPTGPIAEAFVTIKADVGNLDKDVQSKLDASFAGVSKKADEALAPLASKVEQTASKVENRFASMGSKISSSFSAYLGPLAGPFDKLVSHIGSGLDQLTGSGSKLSGLQSLGKDAALGFGVAGVAVAGYAFKMGQDLQSADSALASHANISQGAAQKIGDELSKSAFKVTFSSEEQVKALTPVAGQLQQITGHSLTAGDAQKVMAASMDLAEAAQIPLASSTQSLVALMQVYGINVKGAGGATDVLWGASTRVNVPVTTLATALDKLKGKLGDAAPPLAQSAGLIDLFAQHGLTGTRATGALASALNGLYVPTKAAGDQLGALGVKTTDMSGKALPLTDVVGQLHDKFAQLNPVQQEAAAKAIFGSSAYQTMLSVVRQGPGALDAATAAAQKQGSAHEAAEKATKNFKGEMQKLEAGVKTLAAQIGEKLIPIVNRIVSFIADHITVFEIAAAVIGGVLVVAILAWVAGLVAAAAATIIAMAPLLLIVAAVTAVGLAIAYLATHWHQVWSDIKQWIHDAVDWIKSHIVLLVAAIALPIAPIAYLATHWKQVWNDIKKVASEVWDWITSTISKTFETVKKIVTDAWDAVTGFFSKAFDTIRSLVTKGVADVISFFVGLPDKIITAIGDLIHIGAKIITDIGNAERAGLHTIWEFFIGLPEKIIGAIGDLLHIGGKIAGDIASAVGNDLHKVWDWFTSLPAKIIGAIGDLAHIGAKIIDDIVSGITGGVGKIGSALNSAIHAGGNWNPLNWATGTDYHPGGWAWVGEQGPELMHLPVGTQVKSHEASVAYAAQQGGSAGGGAVVNIAPGAVVINAPGDVSGAQAAGVAAANGFMDTVRNRALAASARRRS